MNVESRWPPSPSRASRAGRPFRWIAGGLLLLVPILGMAADPPVDPPSGPHFPSGGFGGAPGGWGPEWKLHPWFLHGLDLTEDQQDKIFSIEHDAEPALRQEVKALHKAHEELRGAATSDTYSESQVKASTDAAGRAASQITLLRIRAEHQIYALLTPAQRAEIAARYQRWKEHGWERGGEPHGGPRSPRQGRGPGPVGPAPWVAPAPQ